jgi:hypothetical protein
MSWEELSVAAAELAAVPMAEGRIRAAFAGADEEWKRSAALAFGAVAGQRAAEAALVLAAIAARLARAGICARSDAGELQRLAAALRELSGTAAELAQRRLDRPGALAAPFDLATLAGAPPPPPAGDPRTPFFPDGK